MRAIRIQLALAVALLLCVGPLQAAPAQRIMSLNLCANQLLLDLVPPSRITSLYFYSRTRDPAFFTAEAWRIGINFGAPEELLRERPDLIVAGLYTSAATRQLVKAVGIPMLELAPASSFQDIRKLTLQVGHAVGEDARAHQLIGQMDAKLAQLASTAPQHPVRIVGWDGGDGSDSVPGRGTLFDAIITAAGAIDLGASSGLRSTRFDSEQLLMARPDLLAFGDSSIATPSMRARPLMQPVVRHIYAGREIVYPDLLYTCGSPQTADAVIQVRQMMLRIQQAKATP
jgi:iron complex transport system substrate-binding protein